MHETDDGRARAGALDPAHVSLDDLTPHNEYRDRTTRTILRRARLIRRSVAAQGFAFAGESMGAETDWLGRYVAVSTINGKSLIFADNRAYETVVGGRLVSDKLLTKQLLVQAGVRVPQGRVVESIEDALAFQREIGAAIVLKPRSAQKARGVSVNLSSPDEIAVAFAAANRYGQVLAEAHIGTATEYRGFASPDACHGVIRRIPPWVEGDGTRSIAELIDRKNALRQDNPATVNRPTPKDAQTIAHLAAQDLALSTVLAAGRRVVVREVSSVSIGGEPWQCLETAPAEVREIAVAAVAAVPSLAWGGVDIMVDEHGKAFVLEINVNASIGTVIYPLFGVSRPLNRVIYERRLENAPRTLDQDPQRLPLQEERAPLAGGRGVEDTALLSELLARAHAERGWRFESVGRELTKATTPSGEHIWLIGCGNADDLGIVYRAATRANLTRRFLARAGIPQPRSRVLFPLSRIGRLYIGLSPRPLIASRARGMWGASPTVISKTADIRANAARLRGKHLVQHYPSGRRLRVIATPTGPLAVTSSETVTPAQLELGTDLATRAVRAVPELRWASVDIVITDRGRALVEGLSKNPSFTPEDRLIAGSLDDVWTLILGR